MKIQFKIGLIALVIFIATIATVYGPTVHLIVKSTNAFEEENITNSFQIMHEIQPTVTVNKGTNISNFEYNFLPMIKSFEFNDEIMNTDDFLKDTKTLVKNRC